MNEEKLNGKPFTLYSILLTNKPGVLEKFLPALSEWNIIGMRLLNQGNFGLFQFILPTDIDEKQVIEILNGKGYVANAHTYYGVTLGNTPGEFLNKVVTPLAKIGVNITDTFVTSGDYGLTRLFITFDVTEKGIPVLNTIPMPALDREAVPA